jgi:hypothetical protein
MGLLVTVYYNKAYRACANKGDSTWAESICVVNVEGPFQPSAERPAYVLTTNACGNPVLQPQDVPEGMVGPMDGGNFGSSCDSRFNIAVRKLAGFDFYGAVPIHDRFDTQADYNALSQ